MPDVLVVVDVDPHERDRWMVSAEGKGLDVAIEVCYKGNASKDLVHNVERYARLGIPEYFVFDRRALTLRGWALRSPESEAYEPLLEQAGRLRSRVLGLDLVVEGKRLRFFHGTAPLLYPRETVLRLQRLVDEQTNKREEAERARSAEQLAHGEAERALAQEQRAREKEQRARELVERRLTEALEELERLRQS